ncbi:galactosylgalactosylxylosylprotein 3-beta-glucuronosyltransferase S-like [Penaeus indicus]|uniref:galactosylgalactosylxylosylprotein 3-beta-glucuronosyltransferase S-like n=1 Tax=Penaeus indicus TaxID=29960 RepID=UPI00300D1F11
MHGVYSGTWYPSIDIVLQNKALRITLGCPMTAKVLVTRKELDFPSIHTPSSALPASSPNRRRTIYVVTATYPRLNQMPEMTRLAQTLMLVPDVYWIVVDDAYVENERLKEYLRFTGLPFTYMIAPMPRAARNRENLPTGVANRRAALAWIRKNAETGVIYIADDDNVYDIRLFEEIRSTKNVSLFPVAFLIPSQLTTPVLKDGRFRDWYDGWKATRKYPVDMAGLAISVELLLKRPHANMHWSYGYQEESLLASMGVAPDDLEFKAENCTKIWAFHTKSKAPKPASRDLCDARFDDTNLRFLESQMGLSCN